MSILADIFSRLRVISFILYIDIRSSVIKCSRARENRRAKYDERHETDIVKV